MSLLLVDIGNSTLHWATKAPGQVLTAMQCCSYRGESIDALLSAHWSALEANSEVVIVSVASAAVNQSIQLWLQQNWQVTARLFYAESSGHGIQNAYREPKQLGADRWAAMVAAYGLSQKACCVLDCGTAVTFDVINANGQHLGGWISPGYRLFRQALSQETARLGNVEAVRENLSVLGRDTQQCINFAWHQGVAGLVERSVPEKISTEMEFYITGGDAKRLCPLLGNEWCYADDLVLQGLAIMASRE